MAANENGDMPQATHVRQKLSELRDMLERVRASKDGGRAHPVLIEVIDGLIAHVEGQARAIEDLRSDLTHKQGIVTRIGGGDY